MDRGAWRATVQGVTKSRTQLSNETITRGQERGLGRNQRCRRLDQDVQPPELWDRTFLLLELCYGSLSSVCVCAGRVRLTICVQHSLQSCLFSTRGKLTWTVAPMWTDPLESWEILLSTILSRHSLAPWVFIIKWNGCFHHFSSLPPRTLLSRGLGLYISGWGPGRWEKQGGVRGERGLMPQKSE